MQNHVILSTSILSGITIKDGEGKKLGEVKDMMVDTATGQIIYVILFVEAGFLGKQNKFFAVPWQAFQFDDQKNVMILDTAHEKLRNSPGIDEGEWPTAPQKEFINDVFRHYGYDPYYFITE